jgi:hypothetical protein
MPQNGSYSAASEAINRTLVRSSVVTRNARNRAYRHARERFGSDSPYGRVAFPQVTHMQGAATHAEWLPECGMINSSHVVIQSSGASRPPPGTAGSAAATQRTADGTGTAAASGIAPGAPHRAPVRSTRVLSSDIRWKVHRSPVTYRAKRLSVDHPGSQDPASRAGAMAIPPTSDTTETHKAPEVSGITSCQGNPPQPRNHPVNKVAIAACGAMRLVPPRARDPCRTSCSALAVRIPGWPPPLPPGNARSWAAPGKTTGSPWSWPHGFRLRATHARPRV